METSTKIIIGVVIIGGILVYLYKDEISLYLDYKTSQPGIENLKNKVAPSLDNISDL